MEQYDDAIASYDEVIQHWPESDAARYALFNKGVCLMRKGLWENAISLFGSMSNHETAEKTIWGNVAQCHARLYQEKEAESYFAKGQQKFGNDDYVTKLRADLDSILTAPAPSSSPSAV